jgi:hypothetical protein
MKESTTSSEGKSSQDFVFRLVFRLERRAIEQLENSDSWHDGCSMALARTAIKKIISRGTAMEEELAKVAKPAVLSFECEGCGQSFESWGRLRQHQVDCQNDDFDNQA